MQLWTWDLEGLEQRRKGDPDKFQIARRLRAQEDQPRNVPWAQEINCVNNLKQIGIAFKSWSLDHNGQFPLRVSTNQGGTLELCAPGRDTADIHRAWHTMVMSNELSNAAILVCPRDHKATPDRGERDSFFRRDGEEPGCGLDNTTYLRNP